MNDVAALQVLDVSQHQNETPLYQERTPGILRGMRMAGISGRSSS
jgi:hypothetical protein